MTSIIDYGIRAIRPATHLLRLSQLDAHWCLRIHLPTYVIDLIDPMATGRYYGV